MSSGASRFVVTLDPREALDLAVQRLASHGFAVGDATFQARLRESGSEWLAQDVRLGDVRTSWKKGIVAWLADGTGLDFFPRFWRGATPTLVVACSRATPQGTELVIFPHVSIRGGSDSNDAYPLVRRAVSDLDDDFIRRGVLVAKEKLRGIKNDGSPASQRVVKELLGWS